MDFIVKVDRVAGSVSGYDNSVCINPECLCCSVGKEILAVGRNLFDLVLTIRQKIRCRGSITSRIGTHCPDDLSVGIVRTIYTNFSCVQRRDLELDSGKVRIALGNMSLQVEIPFFNLYTATDGCIFQLIAFCCQVFDRSIISSYDREIDFPCRVEFITSRSRLLNGVVSTDRKCIRSS